MDCTGRSSRGALWMEEMGYAAPDTIEVRCDMRYGTAIIPRDADDMDATFAIIIESPPHGRRAGFLMPIEGDRWIVMIAGGYGAEAPVDEPSFRALAASLPSPEISDVLDKKATLGPVATHRLLSSKRRRYERLKQVPAGFLALGDSICSFNPVYGQGMSSAVLQAVELGRCLEDHENNESLVTGFYKQAAKVIASPWQIAVGADFAYPEVTGPKPAGTDLDESLHGSGADRGAGVARGQHGDADGAEPDGSAVIAAAAGHAPQGASRRTRGRPPPRRRSTPHCGTRDR